MEAGSDAVAAYRLPRCVQLLLGTKFSQLL
jgi:hypothetical protein